MRTFGKIVWNKLFSGFRLQQKLLISYFLLIILPLGIFMYLSYNRVYHAVESILRYSAQQSFEQTSTVISKKMAYTVNVADTILLNKQVNTFLSHNHENIDVFTQVGDFIELKNLFSTYMNSKEVYKIRLYVNDALLINNNEDFFGLSSAKDTVWFSRLLQSKKNILWSYFAKTFDMDSEEATISLLRFIRDQNDYLKQTAVLRVDIRESEIREILKKSKSTPSSLTYIQNGRNEIFSSSTDEMNQKWKLNTDILSNLKNNGSFFFGTYNLEDGKVLLGCSSIPQTDLKFITVIPYNEILDVSRKIRNQMFILLIVLSVAAYFFAYVISASIVRRIKLIINHFRKIQEGEFGTKISASGKDEISELMVNFNYMSCKLSAMMDEMFRIGQEAKGYELKALQGQINPHFLYNTLDLINWTAINNNVPEISKLVKALSKFYKLSLNKGADVISIKDELEHIGLFTDIQNMRFDNAFEVIFDIDERVYDYTTLKIILQPIVENSIIHGILKRKDMRGVISISVALENDCISFTIFDDGVGMTKEELEGVLSSNTSASHGYGVKNINERIKLYYGNEFGLSYSSKLNEGTTANIIIPAVK